MIHLGFIHDFTDYARGVNADLKVLEAFRSALKGTQKVFIGKCLIFEFRPGFYIWNSIFTFPESGNLIFGWEFKSGPFLFGT